MLVGEIIIRPPKLDKPLSLKLHNLRKKIRSLEGVVVAFSGGLDSTILARLCQQELGQEAVAITINSSNVDSDLVLAKRLAKIIGIKHETIDSDTDCVGKMFYQIKSAANHMQIRNVASGAHLDDEQDGSFSFTAAKEHKIHTPLHDAKFTKSDLIKISKHLGIPISRAHSKKLVGCFINSLGLDSTKFVAASNGKSGQLVVSSKSDLKLLSNHLDLVENRLSDLGYKRISILYK